MTGGGVKTAGHAAESGHWYRSDGSQVVAVPSLAKNAKPGQMVTRLTMAHVRAYDLAPGVTTITGVEAKPGLERWKINQAVESALTYPRPPGTSDAQHLQNIAAEAWQAARDAAARGTAIHAAIQSSCEEGEPWDADLDPWVRAANAAIGGLGIVNPMAEVSCAHPLGYGTKADLVGSGWLIDWKGKAEINGKTTKIYDGHAMQLAATAEALRYFGVDSRKYAIGFIERGPPDGGVDPEVVIVDLTAAEIARGWEMFQSLLSFWQARAGYRPNWGTP